jgi:hypothetical protein
LCPCAREFLIGSGRHRRGTSIPPNLNLLPAFRELIAQSQLAFQRYRKYDGGSAMALLGETG